MVYLMGLLYIAAGLYHFKNPKMYLKIMPPYLPFHLPLVYISGFAEIILGVGVLFEPTRVFAAWGTILLLLAIYPANVYMWTHQVKFLGKSIPAWGHLLRLFTQLGLIFWAYLYTSRQV